MPTGSACYIGLHHCGESQLLLASVFVAGPKPSTFEKSLIERYFVQTASIRENEKAEYRSRSTIGDYDCYIQFDSSLSCFLCTATPHTFAERLAWDVLRDAKAIVGEVSSVEIKQARALGLNRRLRDPFRELMGPTTDKLAVAQDKMDALKTQMGENIGKMTNNMQNLDDLQLQADCLETKTYQFKSNAKTLKTRTKWELIKMVVIVGGVFFMFTLLFLASLGVIGDKSRSQ